MANLNDCSEPGKADRSFVEGHFSPHAFVPKPLRGDHGGRHFAVNTRKPLVWISFYLRRTHEGPQMRIADGMRTYRSVSGVHFRTSERAALVS